MRDRDRRKSGHNDRPGGFSGKGRAPGKPHRPWRGSAHEQPHDQSDAEPWRRERTFKPDRPFKRKPWRAPPRDRDGRVILYGWHSVKAALENPARRFHKLMATENAARRLTDSGVTLPLAPELVRPEAIEALVGPDAVHQGLLAEADPLASP